MVKKLLTMTLVAICSVFAYSATPQMNKAEMQKQALQPVQKSSANVESSQVELESAPVDPGTLKPSYQRAFGMEESTVDLILKNELRYRVGGTEDLSEKIEGTLSSQTSKPMKKRKAAGTASSLKEGDYIAKDLSYKGNLMSAQMELTKGTQAGEFLMAKVYNLPDSVKVKMTVDAAGVVTIAPQVLYLHATYGEVSIMPLEIIEGKLYLVSGNITGQVAEDGSISLSTWGIVVTQKDKDASGTEVPGKYYGATFNVFEETSWNIPNAEVAQYIVSQDKLTSFPIYVDQTADNEALLCGFTGIGSGEVLYARLTSDRRIVISPQVIYNNALYGPFCNYPATFTYDQANSSWKVSINQKSNMVLVDKGKGEFAIDSYVIAGKASPSQLLAYGIKDVKLFLDKDLNFPAAIPLNFEGKGTAASPYILKSVDDIKAVSVASEGGNTFAGVYFELGSDLDFSGVSPTSYNPIGSAETRFEGSFDGKGHTVTNFRANGMGFANTGFFGAIGYSGKVSNINFTNAQVTSTGLNVGVVAGTSCGAISNMNITSSLVDCNGELGGGVVGEAAYYDVENKNGGSISNCSFSGAVYSVGSAAGIAGEVIGASIDNCKVAANIVLDGASSTMSNKEGAGIVGTLLRGSVSKCYVSGVIKDALGYGYLGGIAGYVSEGDISECFNVAYISAKRYVMGSAQSADDGDTHTGGLVAYISASKLKNSYNAGFITKSERSKNVGGLVGYLGVSYVSSGTTPTYMGNVSNIENCLNLAQVNSSEENGIKGLIGNTFQTSSYMGPTPIENCVKNCYFDSQINGLESEFGLSTRELTSALPKDFDASIWNLEKGKYPTLKNVGVGTQAAELGSVPLMLRENNNAAKVMVDFEVVASNNVDWELSFDAESGESAKETNALRREGNKYVVKDQYSNSLVLASSKDNWGMKAYVLAIVPKLYDGEGTAEDPYQMKTLADYKNLNEAVAKYGQAHKGDYFAMMNDIDFKNSDEFSGVGFGTSKEFSGTFDGKGHTIHGLKINAVDLDDAGKALTTSKLYAGLFGVIGTAGKVCNLTIAEDNKLDLYSYGGAVAGLNEGLIENCRNFAEVKGITSYIGGIVGVNFNYGHIKNCYNAGDVNTGTSNAGGIAGYNQPDGLVELCQNDGDVYNQANNINQAKTKTNTFGGIVGYNYGAIDKCVNNGLVRAYNSVGGITGLTNYYYEQGDVTNCINNGIVTAIDICLERGGVIGKMATAGKVKNNVYDASINVDGAAYNSGHPGIAGLSTSELISGQVLEGFDPQEFDFKANAYPVLKKFAQEEAAIAKRSMYVGFAPKQLRTNILSDVALSKAEGLAFKLNNTESNFKIEGDKLTVVKPEGMQVAKDSITATLGRYVKAFNISAVPVILKGEGSKESPYLIETPEDWNKLANFVEESLWDYNGNFFKITNDLDFKNDSIRVIAVNGTNFNAELDGDNHTIKNYVYNNPNSIKTKLQGPNLYVGKYIGLIGTLGSAGTVKNIVLDGDFKSNGYIGAMVGENYGVIDGVTHKGTITDLGSAYVSGIAYRSQIGSKILNCVNEGTVTSTKNYTNGIVHQALTETVIDNCHNKGKVIAGTTTVTGIGYSLAGEVKNCSNTGTLEANSGMSGICYTVGLMGSLENCYNTSDISAKTGGTVTGVFNTLTARKADTEEIGGYVKNCWNTGTLQGTSDMYGVGNAVNAGWNVEGCYNTGKMIATKGYASGLLKKVAGAVVSGTSAAIKTTVSNCYNTGDVEATNAGAAGLISELANMSTLSDSYNMGNVNATATTGLTFGGLVAKHNGDMNRCFNTGNVTSTGNAVGGLVGYMASGCADIPAAIHNCFNIGDVESTYTGTGTQGNAGGLLGYFSTCATDYPHMIENSFNSGNVVANQRVGGISAGAFSGFSIARNCYNSGKVTCKLPDAEGRYYWSGTTFTNNYKYVTSTKDTILMLEGHVNCYYNIDVNPGSEFRSATGSRLNTEQLRKVQLGDAFVAPEHGGNPILKDFAEHDASHAGSALILLAQGKGDTHNKVTGEFILVGPEGAEWSAADASETRANSGSELLVINGNKACPVGKGDVVLTCNYKGFKKNFILSVDGSGSNVYDQFADKEVKTVDFIGVNGQVVTTPEPGQVYIVRTIYVDGTMKVEKMIAK